MASASSFLTRREPTYQTVPNRRRRNRVRRKDMSVISVGDIFVTQQKATAFVNVHACQEAKLKTAATSTPQGKTFYLRRKKPTRTFERLDGEVWTLAKGTKVKILNLQPGFAEIHAVVSFFSKFRGEEVTKDIFGWICIKNKNGPVIRA